MHVTGLAMRAGTGTVAVRCGQGGQVDLTPADARAYTPGAMLAGSPGPAVPSGGPPRKSTSRPHPAPVCPTMGIQGAESRRQGFEPSGPRGSPSRPRWNDFPAASKGRGRTRRHGAVPAKEGQTITDRRLPSGREADLGPRRGVAPAMGRLIPPMSNCSVQQALSGALVRQPMRCRGRPATSTPDRRFRVSCG